jgi:hypothetical protein
MKSKAYIENPSFSQGFNENFDLPGSLWSTLPGKPGRKRLFY